MSKKYAQLAQVKRDLSAVNGQLSGALATAERVRDSAKGVAVSATQLADREVDARRELRAQIWRIKS